MYSPTLTPSEFRIVTGFPSSKTVICPVVSSIVEFNVPYGEWEKIPRL
jgi:hypothetical protein